ncbi:glycosyltransferase family 4 protein [Arcticibacter sp. MXS-1]|uniref:glycosyltransferase family 4 protein n=1 Tax=Arcticibacter sp. MXS-1 TaxID=3341726 RepID=UPI0035A86F30
MISRLDKSKFELFLLSDLKEGECRNFRSLNSKLIRREQVEFIDRLPKFVRRAFNYLNVGGSADIEAYTLYCFCKNKYKRLSFDIAVPLGGYWTYKLARQLSEKVVSIGASGPVKSWLAQSDYFVALTSVDLLKSKAMFGSLPSKIIPNGVDSDKFRIVQKSERRKVLCVAALVEDKRHRHLLDAISLLPESVELLCIGAGPLEQELIKHPLARAGRVTFKSVPYEEIPAVYEDADVFTLASLNEAFGIVFIEAMSAGLPVVAHDGPRQRDVIGEVGIFCDTSDAKVYAEALRFALSRPKSEEVRNSIDKRYSWESVVTEYTKLFEQIVS